MDLVFDGLLVLDKPGGMTSREAVDQAQQWFPRRSRLGHTGTLDPLATGVLVVCVGKATRLAEYVQAMGKTYHSLFRLGATSDTDDADGTITAVADAPVPDQAAVQAALARFVGTIEQMPPAYSAAKVTGQRAYALARRGEEVELRPRPVQVYDIRLLRYAYPELEVEIDCGKGTYIRSLARDIGAALGCGAHVATLRRTRVGPFTPAMAVPLETPRQEARTRLLPAALALSELPHLLLPQSDVGRLCHGQRIVPAASPPALDGAIVVCDESGTPCLVAAIDPKEGTLRPVKVLVS